MSRHFVCRVVVCALVLMGTTAAWGIALPIQVPTGQFGDDTVVAGWDLVHSVGVSIQPGSYGVLSIKGQVICPNIDVNSGKCNSGNYWMMYQVQSAPLNTKLNFTSLPGFNFAAVSITNLGVLKCQAGTTQALCGDNGGQTGTMSATGSGSSLTINLPTGASQPVTFYVGITGASLPAFPPVQVQVDPTPIQANKYVLPHIPSGQGYVTKVTATNTSATTASGDIIFVDQTGNLVRDVPFSIPTGGTFRTFTLETDRCAPNIVLNWGFIGSDQVIGVNLFFEFVPCPAANPPRNIVNTVGFNAQRTSELLSDFSLPLELEPQPAGASAARTAGVAISNPSANTVNVRIKLVDSNGVIKVFTGTGGCKPDIVLVPFGQTGFDVSALLGSCAGYPTSNFVGSLTFSATNATGGAAAPIGAIALQSDFGPFSATPVMPGRAK
jgi:hypothetical protein